MLRARRSHDRCPRSARMDRSARARSGQRRRTWLAWDLALIDGTRVNTHVVPKLTTPRVLTDGRLTTSGCGPCQMTGLMRELILSHGGGIAGIVTRTIVIPATRSGTSRSRTQTLPRPERSPSALIAKLTRTSTCRRSPGQPRSRPRRLPHGRSSKARSIGRPLGDDFNAC